MTKRDTEAKGRMATQDRAEALAQERFLFMVQTALQGMLNDGCLKYRDLARRMNVSEARISQMFSDDAANLTIRSIARAFHHLGEEPLILSARDFARRLTEARGDALQMAQYWTFAGKTDDLVLEPCTEIVANLDNKERAGPNDTPRDWAIAESQFDQRNQAA